MFGSNPKTHINYLHDSDQFYFKFYFYIALKIRLTLQDGDDSTF